MSIKLLGKKCLVYSVVVCFIANISGTALAAWSHGDESSEAKTIPTGAAGFSSKGLKNSWGSSLLSGRSTSSPGSSSKNTVTAEVSGEFNGKAYTKTETKTSTYTLHNGKEITATSVTYFNDQGQKVGVKSEGGWADRETTYEYDSAGKVSKEITVKTSHGWTDKPENGGEEFIRVQTTTTSYAYEDVKDAAGAVTGQKVTETSTTTREAAGEAAASGTERVSVTVNDTEGNMVSKTITSTHSDGRKRVAEYADGKWKSTYYDAEGNVYQPETLGNLKESLKAVLHQANAADSSTTKTTGDEKNAEEISQDTQVTESASELSALKTEISETIQAIAQTISDAISEAVGTDTQIIETIQGITQTVKDAINEPNDTTESDFGENVKTVVQTVSDAVTEALGSNDIISIVVQLAAQIIVGTIDEWDNRIAGYTEDINTIGKVVTDGIKEMGASNVEASENILSIAQALAGALDEVFGNEETETPAADADETSGVTLQQSLPSYFEDSLAFFKEHFDLGQLFSEEYKSSTYADAIDNLLVEIVRAAGMDATGETDTNSAKIELESEGDNSSQTVIPAELVF